MAKNNIIIKKLILEEGCVSEEIRKKFFYQKDFKEIRKWLQENQLDPHMPIALFSTEIAIITPEGVIMQIRPCDSNKLGLWGGVMNDGETPIEGAIRELREETGLDVKDEDLTLVDMTKTNHQYDNQDKVMYTTYQYILILDYLPEIVLDEESSGIVVTKNIDDYDTIEGVKEFIKKHAKW